MAFVDRESELALLSAVAHRDSSQLVVLYGRRRIGKTTLITHWLQHHVEGDAIYWVAHRSSAAMLLEKFSRALQPHLKGVHEPVRFADWEAAIRQVFAMAGKRETVLAIDEFPYLVDSVPEFPSLLQTVWDQHAQRSRLVLLLCGSHYHMMHEEFLSGKGPLYGRSTADLLLEEIEPRSIKLFLPRYSDVQVVETYSIIGGVPKYLEMWDDRKPVLTNVQEVVLSPVTIFRQEAIYLIRDEIPEPRTYLAILEALGSGIKSPSAIAEQTGIAINHMGKYLSTLLSLGFIRRIVSLDAPDYSRTRLSRYEIRDPYLRFYFRYIYPHLELIEQKRLTRLMKIIQGDHAAFVGKTGFEELARRVITRMGDQDELPFAPESVGRIWNKSVEIDVAAIDRRTNNILVGECKWTRGKMNESDLARLAAKCDALPRIRHYKVHVALFSKSGFTSALTKRAKKEGVFLFSGATFEQM